MLFYRRKLGFLDYRGFLSHVPGLLVPRRRPVIFILIVLPNMLDGFFIFLFRHADLPVRHSGDVRDALRLLKLLKRWPVV